MIQVRHQSALPVPATFCGNLQFPGLALGFVTDANGVFGSDLGWCVTFYSGKSFARYFVFFISVFNKSIIAGVHELLSTNTLNILSTHLHIMNTSKLNSQF